MADTTPPSQTPAKHVELPPIMPPSRSRPGSSRPGSGVNTGLNPWDIHNPALRQLGSYGTKSMRAQLHPNKRPASARASTSVERTGSLPIISQSGVSSAKTRPRAYTFSSPHQPLDKSHPRHPSDTGVRRRSHTVDEDVTPRSMTRTLSTWELRHQNSFIKAKPVLPAIGKTHVTSDNIQKSNEKQGDVEIHVKNNSIQNDEVFCSPSHNNDLKNIPVSPQLVNHTESTNENVQREANEYDKEIVNCEGLNENQNEQTNGEAENIYNKEKMDTSNSCDGQKNDISEKVNRDDNDNEIKISNKSEENIANDQYIDPKLEGNAEIVETNEYISNKDDSCDIKSKDETDDLSDDDIDSSPLNERLHNILPWDEKIKKILAGDFKWLPPPRTGVLKMYLSYSHPGMKEERDTVIQYALPELAAQCRKKGLELEVVDIDVSPAEGDLSVYESLDTLIQDQMSQCQQVSMGTPAVFLLGGEDNRYLPPSHIPANIYNQMKTICEEKQLPNKNLLYLYSNNQNQSVYKLDVPKEISGDEKLIADLIKAIESHSEENLHLFSASRCLFELHKAMSSCEGCCPSLYVRTSGEGEDLSQDPYLQNMLRSPFLDNSSSLDAVRIYQVSPEATEDIKEEYLETLCTDFVQDLQNILEKIQTELEEMPVGSVLEDVINHARYLKDMETLSYRGITDSDLEYIKGYFEDAEKCRKPILITCDNQPMRSAVLAQIMRRVEKWIGISCVRMSRFVDVLADSSSVNDIIISLCLQICTVYNIKMPNMKRRAHLSQLSNEYLKVLSQVSMVHAAMHPLIICIDNFDKLFENYDQSCNLSWIHGNLPGVYFILSNSSHERTIDILKDRVALYENIIKLDQMSSPSDTIDVPLKYLSRPQGPLPKKVLDMLKSLPNEKRMDNLYIHLLLQHTLENTTRVPSINTMINSLFQRWEGEFGAIVTTSLLSFLTVAYDGLTEFELKQLMKKPMALQNSEHLEDKDSSAYIQDNISRLTWARIWLVLKEYLFITTVECKRILRWKYNIFSQCVKEMYLSSSVKNGANLHQGCIRDLANIFNNELQMCKHSGAKPSGRVFRLLPYYAFMGSQNDSDKNSKLLNGMYLGNLEWLKAKIQCTSVDSILDDFYMVKQDNRQVNVLREFFEMRKNELEIEPNSLTSDIVSCLQFAKGSKSLNHVSQLVKDSLQFLKEGKRTRLIPKCSFISNPTGLLKHQYIGPSSVVGFLDKGSLTNHAVVWSKEAGLEVWNTMTHSCVDHISDSVTGLSDVHLIKNSHFVHFTHDTLLKCYDISERAEVMSLDVLQHVSVTGRRRRREEGSFISVMATSRHGNMIVVRINKPEMMTDNQGLLVVDTVHGEVLHKLVEGKCGEVISNVSFIGDDTKFVFTITQTEAEEHSCYCCYDIQKGSLAVTEELNPANVIQPNKMVLSPNGTMAAVVCLPNDVLIIGLKELKPVHLPKVHAIKGLKIIDAKFVDDESLLMLHREISLVDQSLSNILKLWDFKHEEKLAEIKLTSCDADAEWLTMSSDNEVCAVSIPASRTVEVISITEKHSVAVLEFGPSMSSTPVSSQFNQDGDLFIGFLDCTMKRFSLHDLLPTWDIKVGSGNPNKRKVDSYIKVLRELKPAILGGRGESSISYQHLKDVSQIIECDDHSQAVVAFYKQEPAVFDLQLGFPIKQMQNPRNSCGVPKICLRETLSMIVGLSKEKSIPDGELNQYKMQRWNLENGDVMPDEIDIPWAEDILYMEDKSEVMLLQKTLNYHQILIIKADNLQTIFKSQIPVTISTNTNIKISPSDRNLVAMIQPQNEVTVWNMESKDDEDEHVLSEDKENISEDNKKSVKNTLRQLELSSSANASTMIEHYLIVGTIHGKVMCFQTNNIWDIEERPDKSLFASPVHHKGPVTSVGTSEDDKLLVTASADTNMHIIDIENRLLLHTLTGHTQQITTAAISNDGTWIVSGSHDHCLKVWSISTGECMTSFKVGGVINHVIMTSNNSTVLAIVQTGKNTKMVMFDVINLT